MINIIDKLLLFIYSFIIFCVAGLFLFISSSWMKLTTTRAMLESLYFDKGPAYTTISMSIVLLLISFRFMWVIVRSRRAQGPTINQRNEFGDIKVTLETIENLSLKSASKARGLKDVRAKVKVSDQGLFITIRANIDGDVPIPEISEEIQSTVKTYIHGITGIPVSKVNVYIANISQKSSPLNSRVE